MMLQCEYEADYLLHEADGSARDCQEENVVSAVGCSAQPLVVVYGTLTSACQQLCNLPY